MAAHTHPLLASLTRGGQYDSIYSLLAPLNYSVLEGTDRQTNIIWDREKVKLKKKDTVHQNVLQMFREETESGF